MADPNDPRFSRGELPLDADLPMLAPSEIEVLERLLEERPEETLARARAAFDASLTVDELKLRLARARGDVLPPPPPPPPGGSEDPDRGPIVFDSPADALPPEFEFDGMDLDAIPIDPEITKFEDWADSSAWILNTGQFLSGSPVGAREHFRFHDGPGRKTAFVYPLRGQAPGNAVSVALFADFGTGLYHSLYIARQMAKRRFPYAIHLGDVYYAGREAEFAAFIKAPLAPLLDHTRVFAMNGNHEMFSVGVPYFRSIDERRAKSPLQEQEGSYFCLRGQTAQIISIDTDFFGYRHYSEPALVDWLISQLEHGRANCLTNILLSGDEPYEYGSTGVTSLFDDLRSFVVDKQLVDLWFWGNTHYCALFDRTADLPFIGSCIGHGGYPYSRATPGRPSPAPVRFLETKARFPEWTGLRQDRGNNGYCVLELAADGHVNLTYVDWMAHDRALARLDRAPDGRLSLGKVDVY